MSKVFIIAEAGVNHNGSLETAMNLILAASEAGADAVKFQTFKASRLVTRAARKAEYQQKADGGDSTQLSMLKRLELSENSHLRLRDVCRECGIEFLSTAFDLESAEFLRSLGVRIWKIPSGEITDLPLLRKIGGFRDRILLSTGMARLGEIEGALEALEASGTPRSHITLLHCTTEYPAPYSEVNLRAMTAMREAFRVEVGYSDHTMGIEVTLAAVALGATVIEKHFTLDRNMEGPDHKASLEPPELASMVKAVRNVEAAFGDGIKKPSVSEMKNRDVVRKSIVALKEIKRGEPFTEENICVKRPGNGISPMEWDRMLGRAAPKDFKSDEMLIW